MRPYEIRQSEDPKFGRYVVAARELQPLEIIIQELPLISCPADSDSDYEQLGEKQLPVAMCLSCCVRMSGNANVCSKCGWPVCSPECEKTRHHADNECQIFTANKVCLEDLPASSLINETIFILRLCQIKTKAPSVWNEILMKFEHHTAIRQSKSVCLEKDRKIIANFKAIFKNLDTNNDSPPIDLDDVIKISGIINVNAFSSTKLEDDCGNNRVRRRITVSQCVYPTASLLAHSCIPNASWSVSSSPNFEMTIRTTVKIAKGDMITIAYAPREIFLATLQRLVSTEEIAHFVCRCNRCLDKTERNTFIGAIKCPRCKQCALLEESEADKSYLLPKDPVNPESDWECLRCQNVIFVKNIVKQLVKIEKEFDHIKSLGLSRHEESDELEYLYKRAADEHLHRNHYLLQDISLRIVNRQASCIYNLDTEEVDRFLFHCKSLLALADVLCPGFCRHRALIQFYQSQVLMINARKISTENLSRQEILKIYQPIYQLQRDAFTYFRTEDENDNKHRPIYRRGCNQYVACLLEEMKQTLKYICND